MTPLLLTYQHSLPWTLRPLKLHMRCCDSAKKVTCSQRDIYTTIMFTKNPPSSLTIHLQQKLATPISTSMYPIFTLALLPLLSSAIPLLPRLSNPTSPFILRAFKPGSPIHLSTLNANQGNFWLGKPTSSYCPPQTKPHCPTGYETVLMISDNAQAVLVRFPPHKTYQFTMPTPAETNRIPPR